MFVALFRAVHDCAGDWCIVIKGFCEEVLPRTRGFTGLVDAGRRQRPGSPAHARVHRRRTARLASRRWLSRARAGSPFSVTPAPVAPPALPRTRGFTPGLRQQHHHARGASAQARVHRRSCYGCRCPGRFSRARAGSPARYSPSPGLFQALPRTRGLTVEHRPLAHDDVGSPAHARESPGLSITRARLLRLSRARAGSPLSVPIQINNISVLPRTRGFTAHRAVAGRVVVGSPAHARVHRSGSRCRSSRKRFSRARGFTGAILAVAAPVPGSPAHARVHRRNAEARARSLRLSRARAGSPQIGHFYDPTITVLPRTRGFTDPVRRLVDQPIGSSAHARVLRRRRWSVTAIAKTNSSGATRSLIGHSLDVAYAAQTILSTGVSRARLSTLAGISLTDVHVDRLSVLVGLHDFGKATQGFQVRIGALAGADGGHLAEAHAGLRHSKISAALAKAMRGPIISGWCDNPASMFDALIGHHGVSDLGAHAVGLRSNRRGSGARRHAFRRVPEVRGYCEAFPRRYAL